VKLTGKTTKYIITIKQSPFSLTAPVRQFAPLDSQNRVVGAIEAFRVRSPEGETHLSPAVVHQLHLAFGELFVAGTGCDGRDLAYLPHYTQDV
jgi:hypothetical protein